MNHEIVNEYLKEVKKELSGLCSADEFLSSMREYLDDYCDEHPDCTLEDLECEFGTPEEVAGEFLESKGISNSGKINSSCSGSRIDSGDCLLQGCAEPVYAGKSNGCDCSGTT